MYRSMSTRSYGRSGSSSSVVGGLHRVVHDACRRPSTTGCRRRRGRRPICSASIELQQRPLALRSDDEVDERRRAAPCRCAASESSRPTRSARAAARARTARQTATACVSCGPGMTVTASSARSRARHAPTARSMIAAAGSRTTLPSTSVHGSRPSSTAASDITDSGSGCLPGVVDSGLKRTIIAPPRRRTPPARAPQANRATAAAAARQRERAARREEPRRAAPAARRPRASDVEGQKADARVHDVASGRSSRPEPPQLVGHHRVAVARRRETSASPSRRARRRARACGAPRASVAPDVRRVVKRPVEHDEVELARRERQRVEVGLDARERRRVVAARAETVRRRRRAQSTATTRWPSDGEPVRQPAVAGAEIEDAQRPPRPASTRRCRCVIALAAGSATRRRADRPAATHGSIR